MGNSAVVRTRRAIVSIAVALWASCGAADGSLIETLSVPTDGSSIQSTAVLPTGGSYLLQVSGTFDIGGSGDGLADAEYYDFSDPPLSVEDFSRGVDLGVMIDGVKPRWGAFASDHIYTIGYTGTGNPLAASYLDTVYNDNVGSLTLQISAVPEPSMVLFLVAAGVMLGLFRWHGRRRSDRPIQPFG